MNWSLREMTVYGGAIQPNDQLWGNTVANASPGINNMITLKFIDGSTTQVSPSTEYTIDRPILTTDG